MEIHFFRLAFFSVSFCLSSSILRRRFVWHCCGSTTFMCSGRSSAIPSWVKWVETFISKWWGIQRIRDTRFESVLWVYLLWKLICLRYRCQTSKWAAGRLLMFISIWPWLCQCKRYYHERMNELAHRPGGASERRNFSSVDTNTNQMEHKLELSYFLSDHYHIFLLIHFHCLAPLKLVFMSLFRSAHFAALARSDVRFSTR